MEAEEKRKRLKPATIDWLNILGYSLVYVISAPLIASYHEWGIVANVAGYTSLLVLILWLEKPLKGNFNRRVLLRGIVWGIGIVAFELLILVSMYFISGDRMSYTDANTRFITTLVRHYPYYLAYVALGAPFLEELIFRGSLFRAMQRLIVGKNEPSPRMAKVVWWLAALIVAVLFAQLHSANIMPTYILFSLVLQLIFRRYQNPWANIFTHLTVNTVTMGLLLL